MINNNNNNINNNNNNNNNNNIPISKYISFILKLIDKYNNTTI